MLRPAQSQAEKEGPRGSGLLEKVLDGGVRLRAGVGASAQGRTRRTRTTCWLLGSQSVCEEPPNSLAQQLSYRWYLGGVRLASGQEPTPPPQPLACPRAFFFLLHESYLSKGPNTLCPPLLQVCLKRVELFHNGEGGTPGFQGSEGAVPATSCCPTLMESKGCFYTCGESLSCLQETPMFTV